jgi:enoyl-CoA hydratase/carnithine racemase
MTSKLITEQRGPIGYLVLNTPQRRNALSLDMWQSIPEIIRSFDQIHEIRCITITGSGTDAFCAGADISEFESNRASEDSAKIYDCATQEAVSAISNCSKPVVAAIRGICYGGGVALATACDLRVASTDTKFCVPAARLGVAYGMQGTAALARQIGYSLASEMLITARVYSAHEAFMKGLIHQLASPQEFDSVIAGYTSAIAANAPLSMRASKFALKAALGTSPDIQQRAEAASAQCASSADYAEGRSAFREKRKPVFRGV